MTFWSGEDGGNVEENTVMVAVIVVVVVLAVLRKDWETKELEVACDDDEHWIVLAAHKKDTERQVLEGNLAVNEEIVERES